MFYLLKTVYATMTLTWNFLEINWIKSSGENFTCSTSDYVPRKIEYRSTYSSDAPWQRHRMLHIFLIAKKVQPRRQIHNSKNRIMQKYLIGQTH